jgi:hypothetical protein
MAIQKTPVARLCRAVELGFQRMQSMREARYKFLAQYVGPFYSRNKGAEGSDERKASPINLMYNAVTTLVPNLAFNDPRVRIATQVMPYRGYAGTFELATNHLIQKIRLRDTLRKVITDALFTAGFVKTGLAVSGQTLNLEGKYCHIGEPFADRVDPDDMVIDPMARDWHEQQFVGNRFRVHKQELIELGIYDERQVQKLRSRYQAGGVNKEASSLSGDRNVLQTFNGDVAEYVDLVELYLPKEQLIVTLPFGPGYTDEDVLRVVEYEGPEHGPFHMLGFAYVPDNVLPVAPASIWYYLQVLGNRVARKIGRQAERMKTVLAYDGSAVEDAKEISEADDGETVRVDNIDGIKEVNFGGTTENAYSYLSWVETEFSKMAGNIDLISGAQSDENTLGQTEILQNNGQVRLQDMQNLTYQFTAEVTHDLAFMLHTDPLIDMMLVKRVGGVDQQARYTPEMREGDFLDYTYSIIPYSMARTDPEKKVRRIMEFISTGIPAIAQAYQLLGPMLNIENIINLVAREVGIDEADEIINSQVLQQMIQMQIAQMQVSGITPDGKMGASMMTGGIVPPPVMPGMMGGAQQQPPGGGRPEQPVPGQMGPTGGVSPEAEANAGYQERSAAIQAAR